MKRLALLLLTACVICGTHAQNTSQRSAEAEQLFQCLQYIQGQKILSGTTANVNWNFNEAKWVNQHTGKWPALNCMDYIHHPFSSKGGWIDYTNITEVYNWHRQGGVILIMWHWNVPANENGKYAFYWGEEADKTTFDVRKIFEPESDEYKLMLKDIDQIASYLKLLKQRKIPVLWRPLHEAGGMWFWWGRDPDACNELWRVMYDRLTGYHKLNNLIWVWTQAAAWNQPYSDGYRWYPGDDYVDIVSIDVYNNSSASNIYTSCFKFLKKYSPDKLVALTECGNVPTITKQWKAGAKWLFFAPWYDYGRTNNTSSSEFQSTDHSNCNADWWKDAFSNDYVLSREDFKKLREDFAAVMEGVKAYDSIDKSVEHASYNLNGTPWQPNQHGIRIQNGKRYYVK
ncbi:MAG: beta-mannosidase [Bacteroidaceae bacterium]|nr:beta-mannosidase [Bacteroidaceae bacterium]